MLTDNAFVTIVPDHHDRIIWKDRYYHLTDARVIESEVRAEAQEPVAHACWGSHGHVEIQGSDSLTSLLGRKAVDPVRVALYAAPQSPAPCPKCAELTRRLEDSVCGTKRDLAFKLEQQRAKNTRLQAKVAEQSAEIKRLTGDVSVFQTDYVKECELNIKHEATIAQQAALIEQLRDGTWQPIDAAPNDKLVVVGWLDDEDREHPERYDFDYKEDGGWARHADNVEYAQMIAPAGSRVPKERAPYLLWLSIPCLQSAIAAQKGGAE